MAVSAAQKAPNYREDFDKFLFAFVEEHLSRCDMHLLHLATQYDEYLTTHNQGLKTTMITEIETEIPILEETLAQTKALLASRTDFNEFEKYMTEKMTDDGTLLLKHYNTLLTKLQGHALFNFPLWE